MRKKIEELKSTTVFDRMNETIEKYNNFDTDCESKRVEKTGEICQDKPVIEIPEYIMESSKIKDRLEYETNKKKFIELNAGTPESGNDHWLKRKEWQEEHWEIKHIEKKVYPKPNYYETNSYEK